MINLKRSTIYIKEKDVSQNELLILVIGISVLLLISLVFWFHKKKTTNIEEDMKSWLKRSKDDLLMAWGPPTSVFPMDNGKEIWSYNKIKQR
jgi:hypothetical protein